MKRMTVALFSLTLLLTFALSGCQKNAETPPAQEGLPTAPITVEHDPAWWWQNYLALMVYPLQRDYPYPGSLTDEEFRLEYCLLQGVLAGDIPPVESQNEDRRMSLEQFAAYSRRYFGVEELPAFYGEGLPNLPAGWVGGDINENVFPADPTATGDWAFEVLSATPMEGNRVEVKVGRKDSGAPGGYDMMRYFTFAHSGEDQYRLERVVTEYNEAFSPTPVFTGDVRLSQWAENTHALSNYSTIGIVDNTIYMGEINETLSRYRIGAYDFNTGALLSTCDLALESPFDFLGARMEGENPIITTRTGLYTYSPTLTLLSTDPVPEEQNFSIAGKYRAYLDKVGIYLEEEGGEPRLLVAHPNPQTDDYGFGGLGYGDLQFSPDERYLIATLYGYESVEGTFVYNLETGAVFTDREGYGWYSGYAGIYGDWLVKFLAEGNEGGDTSQVEFYNLVTGEKKRLTPPSVDPSLWMNPIPTEKGLCYPTVDGYYGSKEPIHLCLLDPAAGTVKTLDFSATYASLEFLAEREGRLLFLYRRNVGGPVLGIVSVGL